jgi:ubiquinone/menaquinone biosynthesis C-methylase UbiE
MQADWDRRIKHDYRFWMSESYVDDEAMFKSGYRDLEILTSDIVTPSPLIAVELGCGVGRILRAASEKFSHVHGIDVSKEGITKARELLSSISNVTLHVGDGVTIPLPSASADVVYSFASLVCMPVDVIAGYLIESRRVLKTNGTLRIQLYLGKEQPSAESDTLSMRVFDEQNFVRAAQCAGFEVDKITELKLPLQVSFEESGIKAVTAVLTPNSKPPMAKADVSRALLPKGEGRVEGDLTDADLEYWMLLNYSHELLTKGEKEKGAKSFKEALSLEKGVTVDTSELKEKIRKLL